MQRTALITGGNRGLGLETARQLAARDWRVIVGSRDPAKARGLVPGADVRVCVTRFRARRVSAAGEILDRLARFARHRTSVETVPPHGAGA